MALIQEDGSNVAGANTYGTTTGLCAYASLRNVQITGTDTAIEAYLIHAMDYIEGQHARFQGMITTDGQPLQWPRVEVYIDRLPVNSDEIPNQLIYAQYALAMESFAGNDLLPTRQPTDPAQFTRQKLGPLELEYSEPKVSRSFTPAFSKADALLSQLFKRNGLAMIRA